MPSVTLRPDSAIYSSGGISVVGAASTNAATSDNTDAGYVHGVSGPNFHVGFGTSTIPAGSVVSTFKVRARARWGASPATLWSASPQVAGVGTSGALTTPLTASFADYVGAPVGYSLTQAQVDALSVLCGVAAGGAGDFDVSELYLDILYATQPTVSVSAPTGTLTSTNSPTVAWGYNPGTDGGAQTQYRVRTFTAAQYGAGGFDPATSVATHDTGVVLGAATSAVVGPLPNATTHRSYVAAAQTINGAPHWSAWTSSPNYTISVTTSDITSVVATAQSGSARNQIAVTRNAGTPLWTSVEVQASYDGGTTWTYVRGYTRFAPPSSPFTLFDYEAPNGTAALYRARATYQLSGLDVTGSFVSSGSVTWSGTDLWLKDVTTPSRNMIGNNVLMPEPDYDRPQGVFRILGAQFPVVVSDVLQAGVATITLETYTVAEGNALKLVCRAPVMLIQAPVAAGFWWGNRYVAPGRLSEQPKSQETATDWRVWVLVLTEVAQPPDTGIN